MTNNPNSSNHASEDPDKSMPLLEHLKELRKRIVWSLYFFIFWFLICYMFSKELLGFLKTPIEEPLAKYSSLVPEDYEKEKAEALPGTLNCTCTPITGGEQLSDSDAGAQNPSTSIVSAGDVKLQCHCENLPKVAVKPKSNLVFLSIPEVFIAELRTSFFISLFFSVPFILIQVGLFIFPALYKKTEKLIFWYFSIGGYLFFIFGALFGYYYVFPIGFDFFLGLAQPGEIMPTISLENYLSFAMMMLFSFGIVFELPLVVFVLAKLGLVTTKMLLSKFKFVLLGILVVSAILTPPDPFSMMMMAVPLIGLYFVGIFFSIFARPPKKKSDSANE